MLDKFLVAARRHLGGREIHIRQGVSDIADVYAFPEPIGSEYRHAHHDPTPHTQIYHEHFYKLMSDLQSLNVANVQPNRPVEKWKELIVVLPRDIGAYERELLQKGIDRALVRFASRHFETRNVHLDRVDPTLPPAGK